MEIVVPMENIVHAHHEEEVAVPVMD